MPDYGPWPWLRCHGRTCHVLAPLLGPRCILTPQLQGTMLGGRDSSVESVIKEGGASFLCQEVSGALGDLECVSQLWAGTVLGQR